MRLVSLKNIENGMKLGKTVYDNRGNVILPAGTVISQYINQLKNFKIEFLYVDDVLSKDIEPVIIITERTRKATLEAMEKAKRVFKPVDNPYKRADFQIPYFNLVKFIAEDISKQPDNRIDVTELQLNKLYQFDHALNVGIIAALIGKLLGMPAVDLEKLVLGGLLHEVGYLGIPQDVLRKISEGKQTSYDMEFFHRHPRIGYDMIKQDNSLDVSTKAAVFQHLENFDGTGYPLHKKGDEITAAGRIVAIANAFDAALGGGEIRLGNKPMKIYEAVEYIQSNAGTLFDPELAKLFADNVIVFPNGTMVRLSDGRKGIVINQNPKLTSRPIVRITEGVPDKPALGVANLLEDMSLVISDIEI